MNEREESMARSACRDAEYSENKFRIYLFGRAFFAVDGELLGCRSINEETN